LAPASTGATETTIQIIWIALDDASKVVMAIGFEFSQTSVIIAQRGRLAICDLRSSCGISL
jgi:hypothetical protein